MIKGAPMTDVFDLTGRRALVTGGCRGIGAAIATAFAQRGAEVLVHGRGDEKSRVFAAEHGFSLLQADFNQLDQVHAMVVDLISAGRPLDILVNNAGMEVNATVEHLDPEALSRQLRINLEAPILLTHGLIPLLKRSSHASIINITSIHASVPAYANAVYCAAKAGIEQFTNTLAIELGPAGVRVNSIAPGAVSTDMNRELLDHIGRELFAEWIPLGRLGEVADIAGPAVFLASDASSYVTAATLVVDGAYSHNVVRYRSAE